MNKKNALPLMKTLGDMKIRYEPFGGIIAQENPPSLVFADHAYIENLTEETSPFREEPDRGILSAPVEAHFAITDHCSAGCPGCYMNSQKIDTDDTSGEAFSCALEIARSLADMGIFHIALGGGESFEMPWFIELAREIRALGMIPNVTTNGFHITPEVARQCSVFGQVNVSIDGIGTAYDRTRPAGGFERADRALKNLKDAGIRSGINCVITGDNFSELKSIIAYGKKMNLTDIEFLRFKPTGRGKEEYDALKLTPEQTTELLPSLRKLARRYRLGIKLDCSFTPFICHHNPPKKILEYFAIMGCDAGNWLIGVSPDGMANPCSFVEGHTVDVHKLKNLWPTEKTFATFRDWHLNAPEPCRSCSYLEICKGGCHAVAHHVRGSWEAPDPECPRVLEFENKKGPS